MMTMTMRVKFADVFADEATTDIFCNSLNLKARGSVLEESTRKHPEASDVEGRVLELWARDLRAEGQPAAGLPISGASMVGWMRTRREAQRLVEQDALTEMLEEMSLSTLLYYVLAGDGRNADESS
jgi:hypothetical protein